MRKLILFLGLVLPAIAAISQDKEDGSALFIRVGAGYGVRLAQIPPQLDAAGQKHYKNLRNGMNTNLQIGYRFNQKTAISVIYTRFGSKAEGTSNNVALESKEGLSMVSLAVQNFLPISDKHDVNFITRVGPGLIFYNGQETYKTNPQRFVDAYETRLGLFTGIGVDLKISKSVRFEMTIDKTWGRITENKVKTNAEVLALGAGLRFEL
jgi:hypothetical protein